MYDNAFMKNKNLRLYGNQHDILFLPKYEKGLSVAYSPFLFTYCKLSLFS